MRWPVWWVLIALGVIGPGLAGAEDLTAERLTAREWRLFSDVFPMLPGQGHPLRLRPRGKVETANLAGAARWMLTGAGELELQDKDGAALWTFRWYSQKALLVSCPRSPQSPTPPLALAPPGSTVDSVNDGLRALGLYRCPAGAVR